MFLLTLVESQLDLEACHLILAFKSVVDKCAWHSFLLYVQHLILCSVDRPALTIVKVRISIELSKEAFLAKTNFLIHRSLHMTRMHADKVLQHGIKGNRASTFPYV